MASPRRRSIGSDHRRGKIPRHPGQWACAVGGYHPPKALHRQQPPTWHASPSPSSGPAPLGHAIPPRRSIGSEHRQGSIPRPLAIGPMPLGAAITRRRSNGSDHRLDNIAQPASHRATTHGGYHPPQAHHRQQLPTRQDSPSPPPVRPRCFGAHIPYMRSKRSDHILGKTLRPPSQWTRAGGVCRPPKVLHSHRPPTGQDSPYPELGPRNWGLPSPATAPHVATGDSPGRPVPQANGPASLGGLHPPHALNRQRQWVGQQSPSTKLVGTRRCRIQCPEGAP